MYLHNVDWLNRCVGLHRLGDWHWSFSQWHRSRSRGGGAFAHLFLFLLPIGPVKVAGQLKSTEHIRDEDVHIRSAQTCCSALDLFLCY